MNIRLVRENLGRCKASFLKAESLRAAAALISALKDIVAANAGAALPTDVRGLIRECVQFLSRDPELKPLYKTPPIYQPGQEKALMLIMADAYRQLHAAKGRESRDVALERKQNLDHSLNTGLRLLSQGNATEADAAFQEALGYYKDEQAMFMMISKALVEAGQHRRAYGYLKRGLGECTGSIALELQNLYAEVQKVRGVAENSDVDAAQPQS